MNCLRVCGLNLLTSSEGGTENEKCLSRKKKNVYIKWNHKLTLTVLWHIQHTLFECFYLKLMFNIQTMRYSIWVRNTLKGAIMSSIHYTSRVIIEILHPLEGFKGIKRARTCLTEIFPCLCKICTSLNFKRKLKVVSCSFFLLHFIIFKC